MMLSASSPPGPGGRIGVSFPDLRRKPLPKSACVFMPQGAGGDDLVPLPASAPGWKGLWTPGEPASCSSPHTVPSGGHWAGFRRKERLRLMRRHDLREEELENGPGYGLRENLGPALRHATQPGEHWTALPLPFFIRHVAAVQADGRGRRIHTCYGLSKGGSVPPVPVVEPRQRRREHRNEVLWKGTARYSQSTAEPH